MNYSSITIQGNIISGEILEKIRTEPDYAYQTAKDFGLERRGDLREAIGNAWAEARTLWELYKQKVAKLPEGDPGTTLTRKFWIVPLMYELGYDLEPSEAVMEAGRSFNISHKAANIGDFPVLIMGYHDPLDKKPERQIIRVSPHALVQEYLNYTEHLYGLATNGRSLRLLRDSNRLTKLAFIEFDIERMMEEDLYHEFALMYRLVHGSRMPKSQDEAEKAIIEQYHQESIDSGARIREKLRNAVQDAMELMADGFLSHPANETFRQSARQKQADPAQFYHLLLRVVYRFIFLATIEERDLVYPETRDEQQKKEQARLKKIYENYYSLNRLRNLALSPAYIAPNKTDLWQSLVATFRLFEPGYAGTQLGILPLGGDLFGKDALKNPDADLYALRLDNRHFLQMMSRMTVFTDERGVMTRVNYRDLDVEELGSVYESLLELHPYFDTAGAAPKFGFSTGSERKTTGSYYTRHDLVAQLINSALIPVMEERLQQAGWDVRKKGHKQEAEKALLDIKVCDPAAGSGHFLLAAARLLGFTLAKIRSGEENPGEDHYLPALRDVIEHCIYGVDLNPAAVELCRLSLWLIGHNKGKPLTFLEHKIKCGNSLVGLDTLDRLPGGIPDGAFRPLTGDDKYIAAQYRKLNASYVKGGQFSMFQAGGDTMADQGQLTAQYKLLSDFSVDSIHDFERKQRQYSGIRSNPAFLKAWHAANLFTSAFFQPYRTDREDHDLVTTETVGNFISSNAWSNEALIRRVEEMAEKHHFFHWSLEFPDVFDQGGFDVMLGNPPWERIKLQEKEFFAAYDPAIALAMNKAERERLIRELPVTNPALSQAYKAALHASEAESKFLRESGFYPLTGRGDINTYSVFSELNLKLLNKTGNAGILVPTGIATDDTNKFYFSDLVEHNRLVSLFDFENRKKLFKDVDSRVKFCLLSFSGGSQIRSFQARFGFFLQDTLDLLDHRRVFTLNREDFLNINPNTKTCPIFRTRQDAELTKKIYSYVPVLINEAKVWNPWGVKLLSTFHMSGTAHLFITKDKLNSIETVINNKERLLPLLESKNFWLFDHRLASFKSDNEDEISYISNDTKSDPSLTFLPRYWLKSTYVQEKFSETSQRWLSGYRKISSTTNERTLVSSIFPFYGLGDSINSIIQTNPAEILSLVATLDSILCDYISRNSYSGSNLSFYVLKQIAVLNPSLINPIITLTNSFELLNSSWDIKAFADDLWKEADEELRKEILNQWKKNQNETGGHEWKIPDWHEAYPEIHWHSPMEKGSWNEQELLEYDEGCPLPPFKWDENRRALLKAELDAYFALLYGLERDELRYILDPQDVYGKDFPGETFRVLKEKETRKYGEYRTRRLVLEAYDRLRPGWDMDAHLAKLKEVWEEYQGSASSKFNPPAGGQSSKLGPDSKVPGSRVPGSGVPGSEDGKRQTANGKRQTATAAEPEQPYRQPRLFEEPNLFSQEEGKKVASGSKVTIRRLSDNKEFHYHITPSAIKGNFTGEYKQILPDSKLSMAMTGLVQRGRFGFGDEEWEVVGVG